MRKCVIPRLKNFLFLFEEKVHLSEQKETDNYVIHKRVMYVRCIYQNRNGNAEQNHSKIMKYDFKVTGARAIKLFYSFSSLILFLYSTCTI